MQNVTVNTQTTEAELTVLICDQSVQNLPDFVAQEFESVTSNKKLTSSTVNCEAGRFLILKADDKVWLKDNGENYRILGKKVVDYLRAQNLTTATIKLPTESKIAQTLTEGIILGDYKYLLNRSGDAATRDELTISIPGFDDDVEAGTVIAQAQNFARKLGDMPPNLMNPIAFIEEAEKEFDGLANIELKKIVGNDELRAAGFPGIVQVGMSGSTAPALLEIRYTPASPVGDNKLALVGKGLTFDAGGISLKPSAGMWQMKGDMGGAVAVIGAMRIIAAQQPNVPVVTYIPLAENLPDSVAQRPGDIYQARNGKFIHVDNTDAEGRLVLSDVLTYACEEGATHVVDAATLTGAVLLALGKSVGAVMSNNDDWAQTVKESGECAGEAWWQLPLYGEYRAQLDHQHADLNNTGGRNAGTITAGIFLSEFITEGVKWAHCDVAGTAMQFDADWRYYTKGMSGFAVRSFANLVNTL